RTFVPGWTAPGEAGLLLAAWKAADRRPFPAVAPRRPERFDEAARLIESRGFAVIRRSEPASIQNPKSKIQNPQVYLLDTVGELASLYGEADLAFVGGSPVPAGGARPTRACAPG